MYFRTYLKEARTAASAAGLDAPYFKFVERPDDDLVRTQRWRSQDIGVPFTEVAGHWSVFLSYEFQMFSEERHTELVRTSVGLNAMGVPFAPDKRTSVLRYDYDALLGSISDDGGEPRFNVHINALQPAPLGDHIHLPGFRSDRWVVAEVLRWFTSARLRADLKRRIPPAALGKYR
jgi:hypothetical protein